VASHSITAVYSGDGNFGTSTSAALTQSVNIFAGIDFTGVTPAGTSCVYTSITAVVCTLSGLSNGAIVTGRVRLIDASHNAVTNSGTAISVPYVLTGQAGSLTPASPASIANLASTTGAISFTLNNGNNKTGTLTATVTLNGATYTVALNASS